MNCPVALLVSVRKMLTGQGFGYVPYRFPGVGQPAGETMIPTIAGTSTGMAELN
jgi:hypothetical protein